MRSMEVGTRVHVHVLRYIIWGWKKPQGYSGLIKMVITSGNGDALRDAGVVIAMIDLRLLWCRKCKLTINAGERFRGGRSDGANWVEHLGCPGGPLKLPLWAAPDARPPESL